MAYADDLAILGNIEGKVKQKTHYDGKEGKTRFKWWKMEYMIISRQDREYQRRQFMNVEGHVLKRVTHFKYLGHFLTQDNDNNNNKLTWRWKSVLGYKKATDVFLVLEKYWAQEIYQQTWRYRSTWPWYDL